MLLVCIANLRANTGSAQTAARYANTELNVVIFHAWVANRDGADHKRDRFRDSGWQLFYILPHGLQLSFATCAHDFYTKRQVVLNWILHYRQQWMRACLASDLELSKAMSHKSCKLFIRPRDAQLWTDFNNHVLSCLDINLQQASLIEWAIKQRKQTLMGDVWPVIFQWLSLLAN